MNKNFNKVRLKYPIVVCVGPIRSGTTWIYELLKYHPQCITTEPKETSFFSLNFDKGIDWYLSKFQRSNSNTRLYADLSPVYFINHEDMRRIKEFANEVKIIICLRNPYERLRSIHNKMNSIGRNRELLDYIDNEELREQDAIGNNVIAAKAEYFIEMFGRENVYFFYFDELKTNPEGVAKELLEFLDLEYFTTASVSHEVNPTYEPRSKILQSSARKVSALLRFLNLHQVVDWVKFSVGKRIMYGSNPARPNIDEVDLDKLLDYFKDAFNTDIDKLEVLAGRDLSHWKRA